MKYQFTDFLALIGALGLFLYGMKVMSEALSKLAGDKMRRILAGATSNRFFAVFSGFVITALIQSSSATTLMVVGFANAALLTLREAIGVIMGANIGTTVTAWAISILGFKVNISAIALPLIGLGLMLSLGKSKQLDHTGQFVIGFALLFLGLQFLKDTVPDLREFPETLEFLTFYTQKGLVSVLLFVLLGTLLTVILQSSSATMALTLLMCFEGWIPFTMAAAMVLGENIGTTITANIAALVGNYQAKRTARAHFIFNIIGVIWVLLIFHWFLEGVDFLTQKIEGSSAFVNTSAIPVALSLFHTSFNLINTILLLGFIGLISRVVKWLVPKKIEKALKISEPKYLSSSLLKYPETAIKALLDESERLYSKTIYKTVTHGLNVHRNQIRSELELKEILQNSQIIEIDIKRVYLNKFKNIYGKIVEYATTIGEKFELNEDYITAIRNVLRADRLMVEIIKDLKPLRKNINLYCQSNNIHIEQQYNKLRSMILKVVRGLNKLEQENDFNKYLKDSLKLKQKIQTLDFMQDGTIARLAREQDINNRMLTSLLDDNALANRIVSNLFTASSLLYSTRELFMAKDSDEHELKQVGL